MMTTQHADDVVQTASGIDACLALAPTCVTICQYDQKARQASWHRQQPAGEKGTAAAYKSSMHAPYAMATKQ
jgi:hypothetical protein